MYIKLVTKYQQSLSIIFQLNKRFVLSFLNVHGKLFTRIGRERFGEVSSQMLKEFAALIQHTPPPIGNTRLLQLMCVNMFTVDNTAPGTAMDSSKLGVGCCKISEIRLEPSFL